MKKITLFIFALFFSLGMSAQEKFQIGFRASPIFSWATFINPENKDRIEFGQKSKTGYSLGLEANYWLSETAAFHTGASFVSKGYKAQDTANLEVDTRINAIEIPIGIKFRSKPVSENLHITGKTGFALDINTGYKQITAAPSGEQISRNTNAINTFTADFFIGAGLMYATNENGAFEVGVSYHHGLLNANDKKKGFPYGETQENPVMRLSYVSIDLGYFF